MKKHEEASERLVCFGEVLARLSAQDSFLLFDASALTLHLVGAEANVGAQFCGLGGEALLVSSVPENRLAKALLKSFEPPVSECVPCLGGHPGLHFLEIGFGPRASVITCAGQTPPWRLCGRGCLTGRRR
jgi:2-dehydro-3-deoxygluconokinase